MSDDIEPIEPKPDEALKKLQDDINHFMDMYIKAVCRVHGIPLKYLEFKPKL